MNSERIDIEYPLSAKSPNIIWELISSAHGLERWLADHVSEQDGRFTFTWGEPWTERDVRSAQLIEYVKYDHIRLKWDEDEDESRFWEMRIGRSDLTGQLNLLITDFAEAGEGADLRSLWAGNLDRLHRRSGL